MSFEERLGEVISEYLNRRGIKRVKLAEYINSKMTPRMDSSKLSLTLTGKRIFTVEEYKHICDFLEVKYDYFLKEVK